MPPTERLSHAPPPIVYPPLPDCPPLLTSLLGFESPAAWITHRDSVNILIQLAVSMRAVQRLDWSVSQAAMTLPSQASMLHSTSWVASLSL